MRGRHVTGKAFRRKVSDSPLRSPRPRYDLRRPAHTRHQPLPGKCSSHRNASADYLSYGSVLLTSDLAVPVGSPSRGGDVTVYVFDINQPSLPTPFYFCSCVCFSLYGPFNCISFQKISRQLSAFPLCSSGLISASLALSAMYLFTNISLSPII